MIVEKYFLDWQESDFLWDDNDYYWEDVAITKMRGIMGGGSGVPLTKKYLHNEINDKLTKEEQKRLIKVICDINGIEYVEEKEISIKRKVINFKMISTTLKELDKIKVSFKK